MDVHSCGGLQLHFSKVMVLLWWSALCRACLQCSAIHPVGWKLLNKAWISALVTGVQIINKNLVSNFKGLIQQFFF